MKIVAYYHTYLDDNYLWAELFMEMMKSMEDSDLKSQISLMKVTVITQDDSRVGQFHELCRLSGIPMEIQFIKNKYANDQEMIIDFHEIFDNKTKNVGELHTLRRMYDDCQKEDIIALCLHSKGVTSILNNLSVGLVSKYRNRFYWRMFMYKCITEWKACVEALQNGYDVSGVDFRSEPANHFRGNFFWIKSEHVRKLPPPDELDWWVKFKQELNDPWLNRVNDRFASEMWPCQLPETKMFNVVSNNGDYIENDT